MALRTPLSQVLAGIKRPFASLYVNAASPEAYPFDTTYAGTPDIYPGMVAGLVYNATTAQTEAKLVNDTGAANTAACMKPLGFFGQYEAPSIGVQEMTTDAAGIAGVWVGGADAQYSILAPAFDQTAANWSAAGPETLLVAGIGTALGKLTPAVASSTAYANQYSVPIAKLISYSAGEIIVAPVR